MINKEQMMEKTKLELNKMLAQVGNNISASKLKNTNKETLVQMIIDAQPITPKTKGKIVVPNQVGGDVVVTPAKSTGKGAVAKIITDVLENGETAQKNVDQKNEELDAIVNEQEPWTCPSCKLETTDFPALSRRDNKTEICSACGTHEALEDFKNNNKQKIDEPKNIDEMFDGKVVSLADVKNEKNLKNSKTPKSSSRPDYDKLYDQFKKALIKHGVNIFAGRTNRLGEMKALTHVKGMQWAVLITKTGFRFELFMMDDQKGIEEVYNEIDRVEDEKTLSLDLPTGKSKRYKISMTHDGHDAESHAQMFSDFYEILMIEIAELYPLPKSKTKTA